MDTAALGVSLGDIISECIRDEKNNLKEFELSLFGSKRFHEPILIKILLAFTHHNNKIETFSMNFPQLDETLLHTLETILQDKHCKIRSIMLDECSFNDESGKRMLAVAKKSLVEHLEINQWNHPLDVIKIKEEISRFSTIAKSKSFKKINVLLSVLLVPRLGKNSKCRMLSLEVLRAIIAYIQFEA
jgi:hypothetical protein